MRPAGGWVVTALARQMPGLTGSTAADAMVVLGSASMARLSQERTGNSNNQSVSFENN